MGFSPGPPEVSQTSCSFLDCESVSELPFVSTCKDFAKVREPWDLLRGKCVFKQRKLLCEELETARLRHFAPNCSTFSRAREIPIKNVRNPPKPLRDEENPGGIPSELKKMSSKSLKKLEDDTHMADMSAEKALEAHRRGDLFTLEHPRRSLAQYLPSWKRLLTEPGVFLTPYHTCMFVGSRRRKSQMLIHNHKRFESLGLTCEGGRHCTRSGEPHLKRRPTTSGGKVVQFTTGEESEYPRGFCQAYAEVAGELLAQEGTFVEIFSGPNAPLSEELCKHFGEKLKGSRLNTERGVRTEFRRLSQLLEKDLEVSLPERYRMKTKPPEKTLSRMTMLEAGSPAMERGTSLSQMG